MKTKIEMERAMETMLQVYDLSVNGIKKAEWVTGEPVTFKSMTQTIDDCFALYKYIIPMYGSLVPATKGTATIKHLKEYLASEIKDSFTNGEIGNWGVSQISPDYLSLSEDDVDVIYGFMQAIGTVAPHITDVFLNTRLKIRTRKTILNRLKFIKNTAEETKIEGTLSISFTGIAPNVWDEIIESITEYPRVDHIIEVNDKLNVSLTLD